MINGVQALSYNQFMSVIWKERAEKEHVRVVREEAEHGHAHGHAHLNASPD